MTIGIIRKLFVRELHLIKRKSFKKVLFIVLISLFTLFLFFIGLQLEKKESTSSNIPGSFNKLNLDGSTGKVDIKVTLGALSDSSSPPFSLAASYTSNVQDEVKTWNREYQTTELGLGWNLSRSRIIRFHARYGIC